VLCATGFVLFLLQVTPDPRGHGTHEQMGLPACGWVVQYNKPCPTCGVTTAASHLVHRQPWQALKTQPFGTALAAFGLWLAAVAAFSLVRGRSFLDYLLCLPQVRIFVWGVVLLLASWIYIYLTFPS
jgi:hypothetical protein